MNNCKEIIKDVRLTVQQKASALALAAENSVDALNIPPKVQELRQARIICDLGEGNAPYRPRYVVPDYERFLSLGSSFLELEPARDLHDALNNLLILYKHVPSITSYPVFVGNLDKLLNPFIKDEDTAFPAIKRFLVHIDRALPDSFCHGNLGPEESSAARLILRAQGELHTAVPNLTLKYGPGTSDALALLAIETALLTAKPSFANDQMFRRDFGGDYAIASCYNGLPLGGGSYTLVRLNLAHLAPLAADFAMFCESVLPSAVRNMLAYLDERVRFLVQESNFFESNFLVQEGLVQKEKFTAMFGVVGLAECVNSLRGHPPLVSDRFGHSSEANALGLKIVAEIRRLVSEHSNEHLYFSGGQYMLHAQVGIDADAAVSPGCRIPIGEEPELYEHLVQSAPFHAYFPTGIGDVFAFDASVKSNPQFVLDVIKGAFKNGLRYFSLYSSDADVVRITGYLVKKSDMQRLTTGQQVRNSAVFLGQGSVENQGVLKRRLRIP